MSDLSEVARLDDPFFYIGDPFPVYKRLRKEAPVYWFEPAKCWVISKHEDIRHVSSSPGLFSSERGLAIQDNLYPERVEARVPPGCENILGLDPPRHGQLRRLVSKAFTPRVVADLESRIREIVQAIFDGLPTGEPIEFVEAVSVTLPTQVIAALFGFQVDRADDFRRWSDAQFATMDIAPDSPQWEDIAVALGEMWLYFAEEIDRRRQEPLDDLLSALVAAEVDGEKLSEGTLIVFCLGLLGAGTETTRNLLSGGTLALAEFPSQWEKLSADPSLVGTAVDEMLRWVTPITHFARMAIEDSVVRDQKIAKDDFMILLYPSANRDEEAWTDPHLFDITRSANPMHMSFGWGEHICLGASLARLELRIAYEEFVRRFSRVEVAGEVVRKPSMAVNGYTSLPVILHPKR